MAGIAHLEPSREKEVVVLHCLHLSMEEEVVLESHPVEP